MSPVKIDVIARSPLSEFHAYTKLNIAGVITTTSIKMSVAYVFLVHHGRRDLAQQLLENEYLKWDPVMIPSWLKNHGITMNANVVAKTCSIYSWIIYDQIDQKDSPFRKGLEEILSGLTKDEKLSAEFLIYTSAKTREMILSTGRKFGEHMGNYPGQNIYGRILKMATRRLVLGNDAPVADSLQCLLEDDGLFQPHLRSVLIISDSQWRLFDSISCDGLVVPVSGGRYTDITNVIDKADFSLADFKFVIVYCGTNTYIRPNYSDYQRRQDFMQLKGRLENAQQYREKGTILFSCAFDHPKVRGNPFHARWITDELKNTDILCINWRDEGNPYLLENGLVDPHYFHPDRFHLNEEGARLLWQKFAAKLPGMEYFTYTLREHGETVGRQIFADDQPHSSKRPRI